MASQRTFNILNILSIICSVWYIAFGWVWAWLVNVFLVFPFALIGLILWLFGRKAENKKLSKAAGIMLLIGTVTSFGTLLVFVLADKW
jgi:hypothetical protein